MRGICAGGKSPIKAEELAVGPYEFKEHGKGLSCNTTLAQHQRVHTGEKPMRAGKADTGIAGLESFAPLLTLEGLLPIVAPLAPKEL